MTTPAPETSPVDQRLARASWGPLPYFLPFVVYVIHTLEELPGFASWATAHFGPESTETFAAYHIPLMLLVLLASWQASRATRANGWVVAATAFQWQFGVNALFHLTTWITLGVYSPGVVTGAVVSIPATVAYLVWIRRQNRITIRQIWLAAAIGTAIAAAAIGFLFL
ncbi:HXXEE domain-containing protein [Isoptericola sp. NPDC019482]|uniref:HXXEE domain-containing protein n=1 Tax=Isoptericola sp. NPDC019482 TaxID=3154688 RepID=UPI003482A988